MIGHRVVRESRVVSVGFRAQKLLGHESVEHALAEQALHAAEPLHLLELQVQSGHLEVLGANSFKQSFE
jgi:hypothetical protein